MVSARDLLSRLSAISAYSESQLRPLQNIPVLPIASQPLPKGVLTTTGCRLTYSHSHSSSQLGNRDAERFGGNQKCRIKGLIAALIT